MSVSKGMQSEGDGGVSGPRFAPSVGTRRSLEIGHWCSSRVSSAASKDHGPV